MYRASDVVVVSAPGAALGLVNATSLALLRPGALLVPVSASNVDFAALLAALQARGGGPTGLQATLDVWPAGCWHYPNTTCGPAPLLGAPCWPSAPELAQLDNVLPLPGLAMRDARFWANSAALVAANLNALAAGAPLQYVVRSRNATARALGPA